MLKLSHIIWWYFIRNWCNTRLLYIWSGRPDIIFFNRYILLICSLLSIFYIVCSEVKFYLVFFIKQYFIFILRYLFISFFSKKKFLINISLNFNFYVFDNLVFLRGLIFKKIFICLITLINLICWWTYFTISEIFKLFKAFFIG